MTFGTKSNLSDMRLSEKTGHPALLYPAIKDVDLTVLLILLAKTAATDWLYAKARLLEHLYPQLSISPTWAFGRLSYLMGRFEHYESLPRKELEGLKVAVYDLTWQYGDEKGYETMRAFHLSSFTTKNPFDEPNVFDCLPIVAKGRI